ncbi:MAG TPA: pyridoxal 5'-phosphate synthase glutaminase subunit PdxT [Acidimicrobiales bacterium]|nr:pyridoxal 5'-phosphate synthase glutaminase subunit PdxT [Acidimicrobiales bacterium]
MKVGILALQGDVACHSRMLADLGAQPVEVRQPSDLAGVDALILPGGESTTMALLLGSSGLEDAVAERLTAGMPALGTCAGMILLAREIEGGRATQTAFGAIDVTVRRNAFGRQLQSFETDLPVTGIEGGPLRAVFIRAPVVARVGPGVEVLAEVGGAPTSPDGRPAPVVCRQGPVLVASFHPELSGDPRLHQLFLSTL